MDYFVYILRSLKDGNHYVGLTTTLEIRLSYHNKGRVRSTKHRRPFELIYSERHTTRKQARERERYLKSYKGSKEKFLLTGR